MTGYGGMKSCKECGQAKPLADYYKHKHAADGHLNKCKDCVKARVAAHRKDNLERIRAYDRKRGNRQPPGYLAEYRSRHPRKYRAVNMVNNAIRDGKLFSEPCELCGNEHTHAHHHDYAKPLNVRWLCAVHHKQWHTKNGEGKNG